MTKSNPLIILDSRIHLRMYFVQFCWGKVAEVRVLSRCHQKYCDWQGQIMNCNISGAWTKNIVASTASVAEAWSCYFWNGLCSWSEKNKGSQLLLKQMQAMSSTISLIIRLRQGKLEQIVLYVVCFGFFRCTKS